MSGFHHCSSELYMEPYRLASGQVTVSPAEPLATAAAHCAFWSAGERVLRKLVKHLDLDELGPISSFPLLLEVVIRPFHPDMDDTQLIRALMRRFPVMSEIYWSDLWTFQMPMRQFSSTERHSMSQPLRDRRSESTVVCCYHNVFARVN